MVKAKHKFRMKTMMYNKFLNICLITLFKCVTVLYVLSFCRPLQVCILLFRFREVTVSKHIVGKFCPPCVGKFCPRLYCGQILPTI